MSAAQRYLRYLLLSTLALLGVVSIFNLLVDPYGMFRVISIDGFNRIKSQAGQRAELFKRDGAERMRPNALILGNSRAEIGFDPQSPVWPETMRPIFNLALPGKGVESALDEFTHVLEYKTPKLIVVGIDFLDFRVDPATPDDSVPVRHDRLQWLRERVFALLTLSALADSLATIKAQHEPYPTSLRDDGFNPMRDYVGIARKEGYNAMFLQRDQENAKAYARGSKSIYLSDGRPAWEFRAVGKIIGVANRAGIRVRFVIYPVHAHTLVLFHQTGLWPAFEAWKRELVVRVDGATPGANVELWDFSGFSPFADENVPPPGDTTSEMRWYWEAGHFKKSLGEALLARIFDPQASPLEWGRRLTASNLEEVLRWQRAARDEYEDSHSKEISELAGLVAAASSASRPFRSHR